MKTAREWAASAGLNGLYVDRTLEVLVEAVRAEFREAAAAELRRDIESMTETDAKVMEQAANEVEHFGQGDGE